MLNVVMSGSVLALVAWATVLDGWRSDPVRYLMVTVPSADKIGHFAIYGALALTLGLAIGHVSRRLAWWFAPTLAWLVGFADEVRQIGERGRDAGLSDLLANTIGVGIAAIILFRRR